MLPITIDPEQKILLTDLGIRVADALAEREPRRARTRARRAAAAPTLRVAPDAQGWVALTPQERRLALAQLDAVAAQARATAAAFTADPGFVTRLGLSAFVRWGQAYTEAAAVLMELFGEPAPAEGADTEAGGPPFP